MDDFKEAVSRCVIKKGYRPDVCGNDWEPLITTAAKAMMTTSPRKCGLLLTGAYGCGKTAFVKALLPKALFVDLNDEASLNLIDPKGAFITGYDDVANRSVILDDMGAELLVSHYGIKRDIVGEFICYYHSKGTGRLMITTNLTGPEMVDRYGGRVVDRLKELCAPLRMQGKSKRTWLAMP